jgi:hypothetical protein
VFDIWLRWAPFNTRKIILSVQSHEVWVHTLGEDLIRMDLIFLIIRIMFHFFIYIYIIYIFYMIIDMIRCEMSNITVIEVYY